MNFYFVGQGQALLLIYDRNLDFLAEGLRLERIRVERLKLKRKLDSLVYDK